MDLLADIQALCEKLMNTVEAYYDDVLIKKQLPVECIRTLVIQAASAFVMNTLMNFSPNHAKENLYHFMHYTEQLIDEQLSEIRSGGKS